MKLCAKITIAAHAIRRPAPCLIIAVAFMFVSPAASAHPDGLLKVGAVAANGSRDSSVSDGAIAQQWPIGKIREWYEKQPWLVGCNFLPSTAVNDVEMWQVETFDPTTIDRELGWAQDLGIEGMPGVTR